MPAVWHNNIVQRTQREYINNNKMSSNSRAKYNVYDVYYSCSALRYLQYIILSVKIRRHWETRKMFEIVMV